MADRYLSATGSVRRSALIATLVVGAVALLLFIALQAGAKYYLKQWLLDNGADSVTIETLWLNPFSGMMTLNGVEIVRDEDIVYSDDTLRVNVSIPALFSKEALLEKAVLRDMKIQIRRYPKGGMRLGSYFLAPDGKIEDQGPSLFPPWTFKAKEISLDTIEIEYLGEVEATLTIDEARGSRIDSGSKEQTGSFSLTGALNGSPLSVELTQFFLDETLAAAGTISLRDFPLNDLEDVLPQVASLEGGASLDGEFSFETNDAGTMEQIFDGSITLDQAAVAGDLWSAEATLEWQGEIRSPGPKTVQLDGSLTTHEALFKEQESATELELAQLKVEGEASFAGSDEAPFSSDLTLALNGIDYHAGDSFGQADSARWQGTLQFHPGSGKSDSRLTAGGLIEAQKLDIDFAGGTGWRQSSITLEGDFEFEKSEPTLLDFTGDATFSDSRLHINDAAYNAGMLGLEGQIGYRRDESGSRIGLDNKISTAKLEGKLAGEKLQWKIQEAEIQGDGNLFWSEAPYFIGKASIDIAHARILQDKAALASLESLGIDQLQGTEAGVISTPEIVSRSLRFPPSPFMPAELTVDSLHLRDIGSENFNGLRIGAAEANTLEMPSSEQRPYAGSLQSFLVKNVDTANFTAWSLRQAILENAEIAGPNKEVIGAIKKITLAGLEAEPKEATAEAIEVDSVNYQGKDPDQEELTAALGSLQTSALTWTPDSGIEIREITGSQLDATFRAAKDSDDDNAEADEAKEQKPERPSEGRSFPLKIAALTLEGDNRFLYEDPSLPETFRAVIDIDSFRAKDIDLTDSGQPFSYKAEARVDKHSPLNLSGSASPLASPRIWKQELSLRGYPLANLSPFLIESVGKRLIGGKLGLDSQMTIEGKQIDMQNSLELKKIEMKTVDKKTLREFNKKLPLSLERSLSLLREENGTTTFDIPIQGTLSSLDTSYSDIIVTALSNGITSAVKPMLAYTALGPGGVIAYLGMQLGKDLISSELPNLSFQPGSAALTEEHQSQLDSIGKTLESALQKMDAPLYYVSPKVLPGELSGNDDAALLTRNQRQKLYRLGEQRAENVREYLVEHFDIKKEQLQTFQPGIIYDADEEPTVSFMK